MTVGVDIIVSSLSSDIIYRHEDTIFWAGQAVNAAGLLMGFAVCPVVVCVKHPSTREDYTTNNISSKEKKGSCSMKILRPGG